MARALGFGAEFDAFNIRFDNASEQTVRVVAAKTWGAIIEGWPVDSGRSRANWFATSDAPSIKTTDSTDSSPGGAVSSTKAQTDVLTSHSWDSFYLTNNLPYASVIEFGGYPSPVDNGSWNKRTQSYEQLSSGGYSKQAPSGSVRINMQKSKRLFEAEARRRLRLL